MPVIIDQHTIEIRLIWLALDREKALLKQPNASDEEMAEIANKLMDIQGREAECRDWLKILNQDPGWGELITVEGRKVPKMPTFKTPEEREHRVENWGTVQGLDEDFLRRAREQRARDDAQEDAWFMAGRGPIAADEESDGRPDTEGT